MSRYYCGIYGFRRTPVGAKLWFEGEKQGYTVRASNVAFAICTKPFNARNTVLYTIVDWEQGIRGAENLVFGSGAETDQECEEMLERLTNGESEVSGRNYTKLKLVKYTDPMLKGKVYSQPTKVSRGA
jgi:hypothetical protein